MSVLAGACHATPHKCDLPIVILTFTCGDCGTEFDRERGVRPSGKFFGGVRQPSRCYQCKKKHDYAKQKIKRGSKPKFVHAGDIKERVTALWLAGQNATEIARRLGFKSRNVAIGIIHRAGLMKSRPRITKIKEPRPRKPSRAPIVRAVVPPPTPALPIPEAHDRIALEELKHHHCKAICNEGDHSTKRYCGRSVVYRSYCSDHANAYYQRRA